MKVQRFLKNAAVFIVTLAVAPIAFAQDYPWPTNKSGVKCESCPPPSTGKEIYPFSSPIASFAGRYVDSHNTKTWQGELRTIWARGTFLNPQRNRVYSIMGSALGVWKMDRFFTQRLGQPMTTVNLASREGVAKSYEQYLQPDGWMYAEAGGSGWQIQVTDGQERLYGLDWDSDGNIYLAYSVFGWGIVRDNDASLTLLKQVHYYDKQVPDPTPQRVAVLEQFDGSDRVTRRVALVGGVASAFCLLYDVTDPANPVYIRKLDFILRDWAKTRNGNAHDIAIISQTGNASIWTMQGLINGTGPVHQIPGVVFTGVAGSGGQFWAVDGDNGAALSLYQLTPAAQGYSMKVWPLGATLYSQGITVYGTNVAIWGLTTTIGPDALLYKMTSNGPQRIDLGKYIDYYYYRPPDPGKYAKPDHGTLSVTQSILYNYGGKDYFFYSCLAFGDVYVIESGPALKIDRTTSGSPFWGDEVGFNATYGSEARNITWNFGNPEAGATNIRTGSTGTPVTHRFTGGSSGAPAWGSASSFNRTVSVSDGLTNVDMLVAFSRPNAKIRHLSSGGTLQQEIASTSSAAIPAALGDLLGDGSDGSAGGHYAEWTVGASPAANHPASTQIPLQACGTQSVTLNAHYGPFTTNPLTPTGTPSTASISQQFAVQPVAIRLTADGLAKTIVPSLRWNSGSVDATQTATYVWQVAPTGDFAAANVHSQPATTGSLSAPPTLALADLPQGVRDSINETTRIRLTVTLPDAAITGCSGSSAVSSATMTVGARPDPSIQATGCTSISGSCTLILNSASGASVAGWKVEWFMQSATMARTSIGTGPSVSATFPSDGNFTVTAEASNLAGVASATHNISISSCSSPAGIFIVATQGSKECSVGCDPNSPVTFGPSRFSTPIEPGCFSYSWSFGNGATSTERNPTYTYTANGTYTVTLNVSSATQSHQTTKQVVITTATQPPPGGNCSAPGDVYPEFTGSSSNCKVGSGTCSTNEDIAFRAVPFGYNIQSCDTFAWSFGDGGVSTLQNPAYIYRAPGTYTVSLTVSNSAGTRTRFAQVTVASGPTQPPVDPCPLAPGGLLDVRFTGGQSGCSSSGSNNCLGGEPISFNADTWGYTVQSCDVFTWSFGDGTTASGKNVSKTFNGSGTFTVSVTVSNKNGQKTASKQIIIGEPAQPPMAVDFSWAPTTVVANQPVTFTGSGSPLGDIDRWVWTINGVVKSETSRQVTHTFTQPGTYSVTLLASIKGSAAAPLSKSVTVVPENQFAFLLPVVAHLDGQNNSKWRTDLQIFVPDPAFDPAKPLELELEFNGTKKILKVSSATLIQEDLLGTTLATQGAGPVVVRGNSPHVPQMWTRTYTVVTDENGKTSTYGQLIPAVRLSGDLQANSTSQPGQVAYVMSGLRSSSRFRTNLGLVNPTLKEITVDVQAFDSSVYGRKIGGFAHKVPPLSLSQIGDLPQKIAGLAGDDPYTLRLSTWGGEPLVAYGSMIDNISNDPIYVPAISTTDLTPEAMSVQILPGIGRVGSWKSDVSILNPDSQFAEIDVLYFDASGKKIAEMPKVPLAANAMVQFDDILRSPMWKSTIPDGTGTIVVVTGVRPSGIYPVVIGRTFSDGEEKGTFGQGIVGSAATVGNGRVGSIAYVPGVRSDDKYYTNLGLVALGTEKSLVHVALLDPADGKEIGSYLYNLNPGQSLIDSDVIRKLNAGGTISKGALRIIVTEGGPVWSYASVVDRVTKDPEYVPAIEVKKK